MCYVADEAYVDSGSHTEPVVQMCYVADEVYVDSGSHTEPVVLTLSPLLFVLALPTFRSRLVLAILVS